MRFKMTVATLLLFLFLFPSRGAFSAELGGETPSGIPLNELEDFVDGFMSQHVGVSTPGAAVVIVKDGQIILSKGYGYGDLENEQKVDPEDTVFEFGSISKLFVYTTIMRLWEQGKIDLASDIRQYLPDGFLKKLRFDRPITMLDIMNHTTGFEDYLFDVILPSTVDGLTMEEALRDRQPAQVYEPGRVSSYSNYAVALAAFIAERQTGQQFSDYLMETIFRPLGMDSTTAAPGLSDRPELLERKAKGYIASSLAGFIPGKWSYLPLYPAGGMNGTADDLAKYVMAMMPKENADCPLFEDRETLMEMYAQTFSMGPGLPGFAHGFFEWDGVARALGHGGNTATFTSQLYIVPEERFGVVILTNAFNETNITSGLSEALLGKPEGTPIPGTGLPDAAQVEGTYVAARRMHTGFLELFGFLSMLKIHALDASRIELRMAGQVATLVETRPYVFERVDSKGTLFEHHFGKVYFEMDEGKVRRLSGDFLPLPPGRSLAWLSASLFVARAGTAYFLGAFIALFVGKFYRQVSPKAKTLSGQSIRKMVVGLVILGLLLVINNGLLTLRMVFNSYWSVEGIRIHIVLNYLLAFGALILGTLMVVKWKTAGLSLVQKIAYLSVLPVLGALMAVLVNWQFFTLL